MGSRQDCGEWHLRVRIVLCCGGVVCMLLAAAAGPVDDLVRLARAGEGMEARFSAVNAVVNTGKSSVPALIAALDSDSPAVREDASRALGRLQAESAVQPLIRLLSDDVAAVRSTAAEALGMVGSELAVGPLLALLQSEDELDCRGAAVGLGTMGAAAAVPHLEEHCASDNWEIRWRAAMALGKIGNLSSAPVLSRLTDDDNAVVAAVADWAVSAMAGRPDTSVLERNLASHDDGTVWASAWALGVIGTDEARTTLRNHLADKPGTASDAAAMVLHWLGAERRPPDGTEKDVQPGSEKGGDLLDLDGRWEDRYGDLSVEVTSPHVIKAPDGSVLSGVSTPFLAPLPNGDILLSFGTGDDKTAGSRRVLRSTDGGRTWSDQATLVRRLAAVAALGNGSVIAYDDIAFRKEGQDFVAQMCVSRDGGRSFGPLQLVTLKTQADTTGRFLPATVAAEYGRSSARWSERAVCGLRGDVVTVPDATLIACAPAGRGHDADGGVICYVSQDSGATWQFRATVTEDGSGSRALARTRSGNLLCLVSSAAGERMMTVESADGGVEWSPTGRFPQPGTGQDLCMAGNGILVAAYAADAVRIACNADGNGRGWTDRVMIDETAGAGMHSATSLCAVRDDRLLLIYTAPANETGGAGSVLKSAAVTVRRAARE